MGIFTECAKCDELKAEIERLRELLLEAREFLPDEVISIEHRRDTDYADHLADRIDAALSPERMLEERDAEIERLREWQKMAQEEINRLSGLLQEALDNGAAVSTIGIDKETLKEYRVWDADDWNKRVREALGE